MPAPPPPPVRRLVDRLLAGRVRATLLAVCPNSRAVVRAALGAAREAGAPLLFAATRNQVDRDGGYTGWTPGAFVDHLRAEAEHLGVQTPVLPCLDHGGPWLKDGHRTLPLEETSAETRRSLEACLEAGYVHLHLDATRAADGPADEATVRAGTLDLLQHAEAHRRAHGLPPVSYEVSAPETGGPAAFARFLDGLDQALRARGLEAARPCFVVGDVGTALHTDAFDPEAARRLTALARPYGALLKGHDTDDVARPDAYPAAGMGGANVGPGLTRVEVTALCELEDLARRHGREAGLERALREALVESGRWRKWRLAEEQGLAFDALAPARRRWMLGTGSRYVWTDARVREARRRLFREVAPWMDGPAHVEHRLREALRRYLHAFGLTRHGRGLLHG